MALACLCILDVIEDDDDMIYILLLQYQVHQLFPGILCSSYLCCGSPYEMCPTRKTSLRMSQLATKYLCQKNFDSFRVSLFHVCCVTKWGFGTQGHEYRKIELNCLSIKWLN